MHWSKIAVFVAGVRASDLDLTTQANSTKLNAICDSIHGLQCFGQDLKDIGKVTAHADCCAACEAYAGCNAWTWNWKVGGHCYLKSGCDDKRTDSDAYHSGYSQSPPSPTPTPPSPSPGGTPFSSLGCHASAVLDSSSIWSAGGGTWQSCSSPSRSDGIKKCIRENGQADETSIFMDMSELPGKTGCFVWEAKGCATDMTRVSTIEFDFDFAHCDDVWAAPLWITPDHWKEPGGTSGEIDFLEMCPVGSVATNFGAGGQKGEYQMKWGSGADAKGPKHFTLSLDGSGSLTTRICNLDGTGCFSGAHYDNFLNVITSKYHHHFVSDIWNGHGGDAGWRGCHARNSPSTQCRYAIMNLRVNTKDGQPLYSGACAALNGAGSVAFTNSTIVVV